MSDTSTAAPRPCWECAGQIARNEIDKWSAKQAYEESEGATRKCWQCGLVWVSHRYWTLGMHKAWGWKAKRVGWWPRRRFIFEVSS